MCAAGDPLSAVICPRCTALSFSPDPGSLVSGYRLRSLASFPLPSLTLTLLPGEYAVCRLGPDVPLPAWADGGGFAALTRTAEELSLIRPAEVVPDGVRSERGWRLLKFEGPFAFDETGILASVLAPLAAAGIGILATSTFDTDYLLVKSTQLKAAAAALTAAGHIVRR